mmetsp:Transcript_17906/g.26817  ORF Transcript_17906/g.26817 Transcript_17906/m.26817 type:complete len:253 (+) Transcript_17906:65-823(+)
MLQEGFEIHDASTWNWWQFGAFAGVIYGGLEILSQAVSSLFVGADPIPVRGKHLDKFEPVDKLYININKFLTVFFVYHMLRFSWTTGYLEWSLDKISVANTVLSFVLLHVVYDFFYTIFHRVLHNRNLYRYVHKHHHRQRAPSRGNLDAINVHPFEFVVGEYFHLLATYLVSKYMVKVHVVTVFLFVVLGGILASLNHTRFDLSFLGVYSVRVHDVHHRLPESNYGQYIMLWDWLMGSYKAYVEPKDPKKVS